MKNLMGWGKARRFRQRSLFSRVDLAELIHGKFEELSRYLLNLLSEKRNTPLENVCSGKKFQCEK